MKNETFQTISFWKSVILSMPDNSFYELIRSTAGKLKTPLNKQKIFDDLIAFLTRSDIQKIIHDYIDQTEANIIAAAALLNEPTFVQLKNFFIDEINAARLQDIIFNMEERFIFYRVLSDKVSANKGHDNKVSESKLSLNPIFEQILLPFTKNKDVLFPSVHIEKSSPSKKKNQPKLLDLFTEQTPEQEAKFSIHALQILGLYYYEDNNLIPDNKRIEGFKTLETEKQNEQIAAALLIFNHEFKKRTSFKDILPPLFRGKIYEIAVLIHSFLNSIKSDYQYPEATLKRMIEYLKTQSKPLDEYCVPIINDLNAETIIEMLRLTGLIKKTKFQEASADDSIIPENKKINELIENFNLTLEKLKVSAAEKNELSARINKKLILCESQLKNADIRFEKLEARLMDYAGKQMIAKQAISDSAPLEINLLSSGKEKQIFGFPRALQKDGNNLCLVIENQKIPLAKISLIRRIKSSLFKAAKN